MNPIQQTVDIIDSRIQSLHTLRSQLLALDLAPHPSVPVVPSVPPSQITTGGIVQPTPARAKNNGSSPKHRKTEAPKHRPRRSSRADTHSLAIAATLPEPFSAPDLAKAAKLDYKTASNRVTHWKAAKFIKRVAPGQYTRTAKFPVNQVNPVNPVQKSPEPPPETPVPARRQLQDELNLALKLRDSALAKGQDTLAHHHQEHIDRIEKQLAAA